jgi:hypothetical protein
MLNRLQRRRKKHLPATSGAYLHFVVFQSTLVAIQLADQAVKFSLKHSQLLAAGGGTRNCC